MNNEPERLAVIGALAAQILQELDQRANCSLTNIGAYAERIAQAVAGVAPVVLRSDRTFLIERLQEPRAGVHEDGTEELKTWETLFAQCRDAADALADDAPKKDLPVAPVARYHQPCAAHVNATISFMTVASVAVPVCFVCHPQINS